MGMCVWSRCRRFRFQKEDGRTESQGKRGLHGNFGIREKEFRTRPLVLGKRGVGRYFGFIYSDECGWKTTFLTGTSLLDYMERTDIQDSGNKVSPRTGVWIFFLSRGVSRVLLRSVYLDRSKGGSLVVVF